MKKKKRKMSFYKLELEKRIDKKEVVNRISLANQDSEEYFNFIYNNKMRQLNSGTKAIDIETENSNYVIEIIEFTNHKVFAKVGQQNSASTVAIRDTQTLEWENVPMTETQLLELFTYFYIDFETGIVSYIGINGAPKISALRNLFDKYLKENNIYCKLASIMTHDILNVIAKKAIISKLCVSVCVPSDKILSDDIGLSANKFDELRNIKTHTVDFKLVALKNKNMFKSNNDIFNIVDKLKNKYGDNLKKINVNARDNEEYSQTYDLLQYNFTKTVVINSTDCNEITEDKFKNVLETTYNNYKEELLQYIR